MEILMIVDCGFMVTGEHVFRVKKNEIEKAVFTLNGRGLTIISSILDKDELILKTQKKARLIFY
jgi:hypothetical protein